MKNQLTILIMAGGTGGHVFPALALAQAYQKKGASIYWLGTRHGLEASKIPEFGIPFYAIPMQGIRGKSWRSWIQFPWRFLYSLFFAYQLIKKNRIDVVFGFGGFVTAPGGLAAFLARKPLFLHEQNAVMGSANRLLSRFAKRIFIAFPEVNMQNRQMHDVGNPVRANLLQLPEPLLRFGEKRQSGPLRILILGGSLGARAMNTCIPSMLALFEEKNRPEVWHQTGRQHFLACEALYQEKGLSQGVQLSAFIDEMQVAYLWADLVICRAGALTLAELAAVGLPSILIPFPFAIDDHQTQNAKHFVKAGAAFLEPEKSLTPARLKETVKTLMEDENLRVTMACAAFGLRRANVVEEIISIVGRIYA